MFSDLKGTALPRSRSGVVTLVCLPDRTLAVVKRVGTDSVLRGELQAEAEVYRVLHQASLAGQISPRLLYAGVMGNDLGIVTTFEGHALYDIPANARTDSMRNSALQALHQLHLLGFVHGDVRSANFVVKLSRVMLIDFGFARRGSPEEQWQEMFWLDEIFRGSDVPGF